MLIEKLDIGRHNISEVKDILAMAVGNPTPEKLGQLLDEFYMSDSHTLFVATRNDNIIAVIGIDNTSSPRGFITHLAVRPDARRQGTGKQLIDCTAELLELSNVELETDQDAVDFYRACGFETEEITSQWPGIRRFKCVKSVRSPPAKDKR